MSEQQDNKYGLKKDGTPRAKPGRKLGSKNKPKPVETTETTETKEQQ